MKKVLTCLLILSLLLVGCSNVAGFLSVSDSPSADISDRPSFVSQPTVQNSKDTSSTDAPNISDRNMTFLETDTPHLSRIVTRKGDLEILGMTYGDGTYFALTRRESGFAITGYDADGTGSFAGVLSTDFSSPVLLGFADGYACLYSADTFRTFACTSGASYVWFDRGDCDALRLYRGGYVYIKQNTVTFYGPQYQKSYDSYTIPAGCTFLDGDEEQALVMLSDGTLARLSFGAEAIDQTELSPYCHYEQGAISLYAADQTVLYNPADQTVITSPDHMRVLACGNGYIVEERKDAIRFVRTSDGNTFCMPKNGAFSFGARTENGFLFAQDGIWYLLSDEAFDLGTSVIRRKENETLLYTAGKALCGVSAGNVRLCETDATFDSVETERVTDDEQLFAAAANLHAALADNALSDAVCIYLCTSIRINDTTVPYTIIEQNGTVNILLDVADTNYKTQLNELLTMLSEGIVG